MEHVDSVAKEEESEDDEVTFTKHVGLQPPKMRKRNSRHHLEMSPKRMRRNLPTKESSHPSSERSRSAEQEFPTEVFKLSSEERTQFRS